MGQRNQKCEKHTRSVSRSRVTRGVLRYTVAAECLGIVSFRVGELIQLSSALSFRVQCLILDDSTKRRPDKEKDKSHSTNHISLVTHHTSHTHALSSRQACLIPMFSTSRTCGCGMVWCGYAMNVVCVCECARSVATNCVSILLKKAGLMVDCFARKDLHTHVRMNASQTHHDPR